MLSCSFSSGNSKKEPLFLEVKERSEDSKRDQELSAKKGKRKPGIRRMKKSTKEQCGVLAKWLGMGRTG